MKKPRPKKPPKPRNIAAKSLSAGQFQPKVEANPRAYSRKVKHKAPPLPANEEGGDPQE
jgi:hypothetical protein